MSAELYVKRAKKSFDYIFCDPPFPYKFKWDLVKKISESPLMISGCLLMIHRPRQDYYDGSFEFLDHVDKREYGRSIVDFYSKK